jgi:hypothetical protein
LAEELPIEPGTVVLACPECRALWRLGATPWPDGVFLLLNLGARCTTYVRDLLGRANREGGAEALLWVRHLECGGDRPGEAADGERPAGSPDARPPSALAQEFVQGFVREVGDLADRGVFHGYRVVQAAIWDDAANELRVVHTRALAVSEDKSGLGQPEQRP